MRKSGLLSRQILLDRRGEGPAVDIGLAPHQSQGSRLAEAWLMDDHPVSYGREECHRDRECPIRGAA